MDLSQTTVTGAVQPACGVGFRSEGGQVTLHIGAAWRHLLRERKKERKK